MRSTWHQPRRSNASSYGTKSSRCISQGPAATAVTIFSQSAWERGSRRVAACRNPRSDAVPDSPEPDGPGPLRIRGWTDGQALWEPGRGYDQAPGAQGTDKPGGVKRSW